MSTAWVGLGANLGSPSQTLVEAFGDLESLRGTRLVARSRLYRSSPWGPVPQPDYVNAVASLETHLEPMVLLEALLAIETRHGRVREGERWGPRMLDLDLLLYGEAVIATPKLTVPHPRMAGRAFVLLPLAELAPDLEVPGAGRVSELLARVDPSGTAVFEAA